jgi:hypothetical protein
MTKVEDYSLVLSTLNEWMPFLKENSNLPGPRGNLELAYAAAHTSTNHQMELMLAEDSPEVVENSPEVFVVFCGVVALGVHFTPGNKQQISILKHYANDSRWRIRESVAMALQEIGKRDMQFLLSELQNWMDGPYLQLRAIAAGLCEPVLLQELSVTGRVLEMLDQITTRIQEGPQNDKDGYIALQKGLSYCWSVAACAYPGKGKSLMEKWLSSSQPGIRKIMDENLKKNRLMKLDAVWVENCLKVMNK